MSRLAFLAAIAASALARAQETPAAPADPRVEQAAPPAPADTRAEPVAPVAAPPTPRAVSAVPEAVRSAPRAGDAGVLLLRDGSTLVGRLVTTSDYRDVVVLEDSSRAFLPGHSVVAVLPKESSGLSPGSVRVFLRGGRVVEGPLAAWDDDAIRVAHLGEPVVLPSEGIRRVYGPTGRLPLPRGAVDPARTRAFWAPTALMLDGGEVAAEASGFPSAAIAVGLEDRLTISAATAVPVWYAREVGANGTLSAKLGVSTLGWIHAAGGVEAYLSREGNVVDVFGAVTAGTADLNVSVFAGPPPPGAARIGDFGDRVVAVSGAWRIDRRVALLAEGWLGESGSASSLLGAAGARLFWKRIALDLGVASTRSDPVLPFLAATWTVSAP
jgi:hypothetical protein